MERKEREPGWKLPEWEPPEDRACLRCKLGQAAFAHTIIKRRTDEIDRGVRPDLEVIREIRRSRGEPDGFTLVLEALKSEFKRYGGAPCGPLSYRTDEALSGN